SNAGTWAMCVFDPRPSNTRPAVGHGIRHMPGSFVVLQFTRTSLFAGARWLLRNSHSTENYSEELRNRDQHIFVHFVLSPLDWRRCHRPPPCPVYRGRRAACPNLSRYVPARENLPVRGDRTWEFRRNIPLVSQRFSEWAKDPSSGERLALVS